MLNPGFAQTYYNRGNLYLLKGEIDKAIDDHNKAIQLRPSDAKAYVGQGNAYRGKGEFDKAIEAYNTATQLKPDFADVYSNRGIVFGIIGRHDLAIRDFSKVIQLQPTSAQAYYNRGSTWLLMRNWGKARVDLTIARDAGLDITANFSKTGISDFERAIDAQLPADLVAMLTQRHDQT